MKKFLRFGAASAVLAASLGMSTVAQAQDNASADAFAEILTALKLTLDGGSKLDFGTMVVTGAGTVTLDASDGTFDCAATTIVCSGTTEFAAFSILAGTAQKGVTINFDTPSVKLLNTAGTGANFELDLNNFNSDAPEKTDTLGNKYYEVMLDDTGLGAFQVGGDLTFGATQAVGVYTGSFDVSVEYS